VLPASVPKFKVHPAEASPSESAGRGSEASTANWPGAAPASDPRVDRFQVPKETRGLRLDVWVDDAIVLPTGGAKASTPTTRDRSKDVTDVDGGSAGTDAGHDENAGGDDETIGPSLGTLVQGWLDDRRVAESAGDGASPTLPTVRPTRIPPGSRTVGGPASGNDAAASRPLRPAQLTDEELRALLGDDGNDDDHGRGRKK
jgi:hypothetical protein